jgi:hypothetical protein
VPVTAPVRKDSFYRKENGSLGFETNPTGMGVEEHYEGIRDDTENGERLFVSRAGQVWKESELVVDPDVVLVEVNLGGSDQTIHTNYQMSEIEAPSPMSYAREMIINYAADDLELDVSGNDWHIALEQN